MNRTASITRPNIPLTPTRPYIADPRDMAAITAVPSMQVHVHPMHLAATLSVGQQVTVFVDQGSWLDGRTGTIKVLPVHNGLLRCDEVAVEIHGDTPLGPNPVRWMDPRRIAPVSTCEHCAITGACDCNMHNPDDGCRHMGCWGPKATNTCPGVTVERARYAARSFARFGGIA